MNTEKLVLEILLGKEKRALKQKELIERYRETLISFTLNIPGLYKLSDKYKVVFIQGVYAIKKKLMDNNIKIIKTYIEEQASGYEFFCVVNSPSENIKKLMIRLEEEEPVYRLLDIDVFTRDGILLSRANFNLPKRKCLVCDKEAICCSRARSHSYEEVLKSVNMIIDKFLEEKKVL